MMASRRGTGVAWSLVVVLHGGVGAQAPTHPDGPTGNWHVVAEWADSLADTVTVPVVIEAMLSLRDPEGAERLLRRHGALLAADRRLELTAQVAAARGQWDEAAHAYAGAARMRGGRERALLEARAGAAHGRAERPDSAAAAYARAGSGLPLIAGWLAVRQAAHRSDVAQAESLLSAAEPLAEPLALEVLSELRLREGRLADVEPLLDAAGRPGRAAELALARGDTLRALRYAERAVEASDTVEVRRGVTFFRERVQPRTSTGAWRAARGARRLRDVRQAATWGQRAIALGDTSTAVLIQVAGWLEAVGRRREALPLYARAGADGVMREARARLRLGDRRAVRTLQEFAATEPQHPDAPIALYLAADALDSDSLLRAVAQGWPRAAVASRARMSLVFARFDAGDSASAEPLLDVEIALRGTAASHARYLRGRVKRARGDEAAAVAEFRALAAADSIGYYGVLARREAGPLPAPAFVAVAPTDPDPGVARRLAQLALFDSLGFDREADLLVAHLVTGQWESPDAMLDAAEGLVALGRANQAIRLGYRAAGRVGLNHPRVLRAVFPWPDRELVEREAAAFGLDPYLVAGLIRQESWFLATARSRAGAMGYMQLMPPTAREIARRLRIRWSDALLTVGDVNVHVGSAHLAGLVRRYRGDPIPALAAYNAGGRPTDRWRRRPGGRDPVGFVERIGYAETREYVRSVVRNHALYRWLYGPDRASP
jgi:soluble lytic murein transglycosylase